MLDFKTPINGLIFTVLLLSAFLPVAQAELLHSYVFSGNANDSVGGAHGTVYGATLTSDRFGNANSAYAFDGDDAIVSHFASLTTGSFSLWATWTGKDIVMLFNSGGNQQGPDLFFLGDSISWNTWDSGANKLVNISDTVIQDGLFHHYVVVNDEQSSQTTLYIDGDVAGVANYRSRDSDVFTIGAASAINGYGWTGEIDDVHIFDTALTQLEVQALTSAPAPVDVPAPLSFVFIYLGLAGWGFRRKKKRSSSERTSALEHVRAL
jgi:hypothetical protein